MIIKARQFFLVFFVFSCAAGRVFADDRFDQELGRARGLVEQKSYSQALEVYSGIADGLRRDPGLLIEWARVYTYADRHPEAIKLFEEACAAYPDRCADILRELADQYKWNGQASEAIKTYQRALTLDAGDPRVYTGLAEAFLWGGQQEKAIKTYEDALTIWPDNTQALLGKALVLSYQDKLEESYAV
jgi:tetratricopeptide (TPR) repeat protein